MAIGMAVTAVPALWLKQGSLSVPTTALPLGAPIGLLMAVGSICFVLSLAKLPVGMATAISTSYVLVVLFLSWLFLSENMSWMKIAGTLLMISGVALLSSVVRQLIIASIYSLANFTRHESERSRPTNH